MALVDVRQPIQQGKKGGGGLGGALGGLLGLVGTGAATALTGGAAAPTLAAALKGTAAGIGIGSQIGGGLNQARKATEGVTVQPGVDDSITRRVKSGEAQKNMAALRESAQAALQLPEQDQQQYLQPIMSAAQILKQQQGGK